MLGEMCIILSGILNAMLLIYFSFYKCSFAWMHYTLNETGSENDRFSLFLIASLVIS